MRKCFLFFIVLILITKSPFLFGQDASFSQFYANPLHLNPALAGNTECGRLGLSYRNQWPSLNDAYLTYSVAYDQQLPSVNSGFGFLMLRDQQGGGAYNRTSLAAIYAYHLELSSQSRLNFGMKAAFYQENISWEKLIFADMINPSTGQADGFTNETKPSKPTVYAADFAAGLVYSYAGVFFAGLSADHLTQPQLSFYQSETEKLALRLTLHGGFNFNMTTGRFGEVIQGDLFIQPNLLFLQQQSFQQINAGIYLGKSPFVGGFWYRHTLENADAVAVLLGLQWENFRFGYSYDYTVSKLSGKSGGAHEVSVGWDFCIYKDTKRRIRTIKSPVF